MECAGLWEVFRNAWAAGSPDCSWTHSNLTLTAFLAPGGHRVGGSTNYLGPGGPVSLSPEPSPRLASLCSQGGSDENAPEEGPGQQEEEGRNSMPHTCPLLPSRGRQCGWTRPTLQGQAALTGQ